MPEKKQGHFAASLVEKREKKKKVKTSLQSFKPRRFEVSSRAESNPSASSNRAQA